MNTDYDQAVQAFWGFRDAQTAKQIASGKIDAGSRGAVTGGGHLGALTDLIAQQFLDAGFPPSSVMKKGRIRLPGFYRPTKDWDLVVLHQDILVAAIEFKSQVGPSFGNNFNNRSEEAMGNAVDIWRAFEEGYFGEIRPWLGFLFILESDPKSTTPLGKIHALMPHDPIFDQTSYADRYRVLFQRLARERLYDATCFITSPRGGGLDPESQYDLSLANFAAAIQGRVAYIQNVLNTRP